jgi:uncharacterized protein YbaR (Trm112 family)
MLSPDLLSILCCPETHQPLTLAPVETITSLNQKIAAAQLKNRAGETLSQSLDSALLRADGKFVYPIRNDIPVMLIDQAIPV